MFACSENSMFSQGLKIPACIIFNIATVLEIILQVLVEKFKFNLFLDT